MAAPPALRTQALRKAFGPTQALRSCSLDVLPGEVHAFVGENGSGKSTLVKILAGVHTADGGDVELDGRPMRRVPSPRAALRLGIATVFQEILAVGTKSILDNLWLGTDGVVRITVGRDARRKRGHAALAELLDPVPDLDAPADTLSLSGRQACAIVRALLRRPRVLILDEATSALDIATRDRLFTALARLRQEGVAIVFISHRMDEIEQICDRVTVLRSGETVATLSRDEATPQRLVELMTGADHLTAGVDLAAGRPRRATAEPVLRIRGLYLRPGARPIDAEVRAGELIGLAGLEGHGQDAFLRALWDGPPGAGTVTVAATAIRGRAAAAAAGVAYVPRDRRGESLFAPLSIAENFAVVTGRRDRRAGLLRPGRTARRLEEYVRELGIKLGRGSDPITSLSGGNQQKVVMARWLATAPRVLLLNDPTRGIDLAAKRDLYALLGRLAAEGMAVVMLSTELDEHVELMDRVLVFREGEVCAELPAESLNRQALVAQFFGATE